MTNQILNFGLPAPIDVQVVGRDQVNNYKVTQKMLNDVSKPFPAWLTLTSTRRLLTHPQCEC